MWEQFSYIDNIDLRIKVVFYINLFEYSGKIEDDHHFLILSPVSYVIFHRISVKSSICDAATAHLIRFTSIARAQRLRLETAQEFAILGMFYRH